MDNENHAHLPGPTGGPVDSFVTRASIFERLRSDGSDNRDMAWQEFRARYVPIISGFARRCGANSQDIDDIVQEVMTGFFSVSGKFVYDPARGRFRGWLKTCTVRAALRIAGKNLKFRGVPLDEVPELELTVEPVWNDVWEQQLVARALHEMRDDQGDALSFRAFEQHVLLDRTADEVAAELGTTANNVHQAKTRMTRRLRELVSRLRQDER